MSIFNSNLVLKTIVVGPMAVNCYIVSHKQTKEAFIIDPGDDAAEIKKYLKANNLKPRFIIHTHGHIDHIGADPEFDLPIYIHRDDEGCLSGGRENLAEFLGIPFDLADKTIHGVEGGSEIKFAGSILKIIHTPGHTAGGISILLDNALFSGDTLFAQGIGRTDFPGASNEALVNSIKGKIFTLDDSVVVYPGHGEPTTIGREKRENAFIG